MDIVSYSQVKKTYPKRDIAAHKGYYGKLLVVAGSEIFTGAPSIVGLAALRSGCDTVYFAGPKRSMDVTARNFPTFVNLPLEGKYLDKTHIKTIFEFAKEMRVTALAIGPGLWRREETKRAIIDLIEGFDTPIVADADAIRAMSINNKILAGKESVVTPHSNEFLDLTGVNLTDKVSERALEVKMWAEKIGTSILLKGPTDIISDGEKVALNKTGNANMTKGGFGDMLTGICAAILARRKDRVKPYEAACAAAYISGRAGDIASKLKGIGTTPMDAIEHIPDAVRGL
jgi:NAD(P)H-hydrate epimerase